MLDIQYVGYISIFSLTAPRQCFQFHYLSCYCTVMQWNYVLLCGNTHNGKNKQANQQQYKSWNTQVKKIDNVKTVKYELKEEVTSIKKEATLRLNRSPQWRDVVTAPLLLLPYLTIPYLHHYSSCCIFVLERRRLVHDFISVQWQ